MNHSPHASRSLKQMAGSTVCPWPTILVSFTGGPWPAILVSFTGGFVSSKDSPKHLDFETNYEFLGLLGIENNYKPDYSIRFFETVLKEKKIL